MVLNTKFVLVSIATPQVFFDSLSQTCWCWALRAMVGFAAAPRGGRIPLCVRWPKATWPFCSVAGLKGFLCASCSTFHLLNSSLSAKKWVKGTFFLQQAFSFSDMGYLHPLPQSQCAEWGWRGDTWADAAQVGTVQSSLRATVDSDANAAFL